MKRTQSDPKTNVREQLFPKTEEMVIDLSKKTEKTKEETNGNGLLSPSAKKPDEMMIDLSSKPEKPKEETNGNGLLSPSVKKPEEMVIDLSSKPEKPKEETNGHGLLSPSVIKMEEMVIDLSSLIIRPAYKCSTEDRTNQFYVHLEEGEVCLWDFGSKISWTIKSTTFPQPAQAYYVRDQMHLSFKEWNISGLEFIYVDESKIDTATFIVKFSKNPSGSTVAKAFFPVGEQSFLTIYPIAFTEGQIKYIKNVLCHEIGHIFGLRHEFAMNEGNTVQFGPSNSLSVMNYNFPPVIQDTDRVWLQKLYNPIEPITCIGSEKFPVVRFVPYSGE